MPKASGSGSFSNSAAIALAMYVRGSSLMKARLVELQPYVDEYHQIEAALKRMNPRRGRPKGSKNKPKNETTPES